MSFRAVDIVLRAPIRPPTLKLTAVVLADALNEKTRQLNPSLQTIAEAVGIDRRQAQRYVQQLMSMGLLAVLANAKGGPPGTTPTYLLRLDRIKAMGAEDRAKNHRTDDIHDTPTGGAGVTPSGGETGGAGDADGCHPRRGRVTPMTRTGGAGVTLTGNEPGKEPGKEPGLQQSLDIAHPADADARAAVAVSSRTRKKPARKEPTKTGATWEAYRAAYSQRYKVEPVTSAKVNGQLARLVDRLGAVEAPQVARFYVEHPGAFYGSKAHTTEWLLKDAEKLRTEWASGRLVPEGRRVPAAAQPRTLAGQNYYEGVGADGKL